MSEDPIRVLLVDNHEIVRKGLRALLSTEEGIEAVGEAANGEEAVRLAAELEPSVVLMDLVMPVLDGIEATRQICAKDPEAKVLVLTSFGSDNKLFPAIRAGAVGYLLKDASPVDLIRAIRAAASGQSMLTGSIARRLLRELSGEQATGVDREVLTERELEVLRHLAHGLSNEDLGRRLFISEATVRSHVSNILSKLSLANRTQAALYALKEGIVSLDEIEGPF